MLLSNIPGPSLWLRKRSACEEGDAAATAQFFHFGECAWPLGRTERFCGMGWAQEGRETCCRIGKMCCWGGESNSLKWEEMVAGEEMKYYMTDVRKRNANAKSPDEQTCYIQNTCDHPLNTFCPWPLEKNADAATTLRIQQGNVLALARRLENCQWGLIRVWICVINAGHSHKPFQLVLRFVISVLSSF